MTDPFLARANGPVDTYGTSGVELTQNTLSWACLVRFGGDDVVAFLHPEQIEQLARESPIIPSSVRAAAFVRSCNGGADWFGWLARIDGGEVSVDDAVGIVSRRAR